jgi:hypothetical protein
VNEVGAILAGLVTILASPGGQGALEKLFVEHGLTLDALDKVIAALPDAPDPKS